MAPSQVTRGSFGQQLNNNVSNSSNNSGYGTASQTSAHVGPGGPSSEYTLTGVLHFLQLEWRRFERERNEWEIERAEMRARVALLEGERRGMDNAKTDLMKRIKMLEYALRQERTRSLAASTTAGAIPSSATIAGPSSNLPVPNSLTLADNKKTGGQSTSVSSGGSPELKSQKPLAAAVAAGPSTSAMAPKAAGADATNQARFNPHARAQQTTRDPKNWAKSREYLKACLQEIDYLTSNTTLNPLANRQGMPTKDLNQERTSNSDQNEANSVWWDEGFYNTSKPNMKPPGQTNGSVPLQDSANSTIADDRESVDIGSVVKRPVPRSLASHTLSAGGGTLGPFRETPSSRDDVRNPSSEHRDSLLNVTRRSPIPTPIDLNDAGMGSASTLDEATIAESATPTEFDTLDVPAKVDELEGSPIADQAEPLQGVQPRTSSTAETTTKSGEHEADSDEGEKTTTFIYN